ncbi:MAG: DNA mismatch repair protein MutS [Rhodobacteraceae bacterium]|nr:DNA mismatch repair protein MutS [Paracoccaceae bacterium]
MMVQYHQIKSQYPDCLLFFRMGDFYELFYEDAKTASAALDIVLTKRGKNRGREIPLCGVPAHSADRYLQTLIRKGFRVAVCEQTEDPAVARKRGSKAVIARKVVRVLTSGTLTEDALLDSRSHNFLAAVTLIRGQTAIAWTDISVGNLHVMACLPNELPDQLGRVSPHEILYSENADKDLNHLLADWKAVCTEFASVHFDSISATQKLCALFSVRTLDAYGEFSRTELSALGAITAYLDITQKGQPPLLRPPVRETIEETMHIDCATRRNLEISRDFSGNRDASLLGAVDYTLTAPGARLLDSRVSAPSTCLDEITRRQRAVTSFFNRSMLRQEVRKELRRMADLNRPLSRIFLHRGTPQDLGALRNGLRRAKIIHGLLQSGQETLPGSSPTCLLGDAVMETALQGSMEKIDGFGELLEELEAALADELPVQLRDGGLICHGYDEELDAERSLDKEGRSHIGNMQAELASETGISSLKIKHNQVLGYFVEVPSAHGEKLLSTPHKERFTHRHTVVNALRFTTADLAEAESRLLNAAARILEIEGDIFNRLCARVVDTATAINQTAEGLAEIDVVAAWAELATERNWIPPRLDNSGILDICGGRHPVVEQALRRTGGQPFVANDCQLADMDASPRVRLITGPNMAGKSTYLRQNALIVLLAQTGAYVPADSAQIGLVSQLFSRVGAADELARGRSTFMVEMIETAAILNQAKPNALVILDEIGRGTATYDGLSIAWATLEHLHDISRCRALFATHYHELTQLSEKLERLQNSTVVVREWENEIIFLYEVRNGAAERSYGVQVAKLAGMPESAVARACDILASLETDQHGTGGKTAALFDDLPLFAAANQTTPRQEPSVEQKLRDRLETLNPDELSPRDALALIYELKGMTTQS